MAIYDEVGPQRPVYMNMNSSRSDAILVVDVQASFAPPAWLVQRISAVVPHFKSLATVERHNEATVPFRRQLGWAPAADDDSLILTERTFVKHGYCPPPELLVHLRDLGVERVFVCGLQAETCVLAAGFLLFDAGLRPTLLSDLVVGSSLDRSGNLGVQLWRHHFGEVLTTKELIAPP
jgi:nicotinamidase-related amidase